MRLSLLLCSMQWGLSWWNLQTTKGNSSIISSRSFAFINALQRLNQQKDPNGDSVIDRFTKIHLEIGKNAHGTPAFLPWHRYFIREFEKELQKVDSSIMIPYWDWSVESQNPQNSIVFSEAYFGGNSAGSAGCLQNSSFASWNVKYPTPHCLRRSFSNGNGIGAFYATEIIQSMVRSSTSYASFESVFEAGPHGTVHANIGGDMAQMESPNDPIFWLHHAYVDKIWTEFQSANPANATAYNGIQNPQINSTNILLPFGITVANTFSTEPLCYTYSSYITQAQRPALISFLAYEPYAYTGYQLLNESDEQFKKASLIAKDMFNQLKENELPHCTNNSQNSPKISPGRLEEVPSNPLKLQSATPVTSEWLHCMEIEETHVRFFEGKIALMYQMINRSNSISIACPYYVSNCLAPEWKRLEEQTKNFIRCHQPLQ